MACEGKTITEGLAAVKLLKKRIKDLRTEALRFLVRDSRLKDPLEASGGSGAYVQQKMQAAADLESELVKLLARISATNHETTLTVGGVTQPILHWIIARRETYSDKLDFFNTVKSTIDNSRKTITKYNANQQTPDEQKTAGPMGLIVNIDEAAFQGQVEKFVTIQGELDGQLSLKNATTTIKD